MKRFAFAVFAVAVLGLTPTVWADVQHVFTPGSAGVGSAINSGGFFVRPDTFGLSGALSYVYDGQLVAGGAPYWTGNNGPAYSDAGLVVDGGFTLGELKSVSVVSTGSPLGINLWLDTGGDGKFFSIDNASGLFEGLNGDSYAGCGAPTLTTATSCYMLGGDGAGEIHTLADLQAGLVSGISGDTPTALWIGVTHGNGDTPIQDATINSITVTTVSAVPEPGSIALLVTMVGMVGITRRRFRKS